MRGEERKKKIHREREGEEEAERRASREGSVGREESENRRLVRYPHEGSREREKWDKGDGRRGGR